MRTLLFLAIPLFLLAWHPTHAASGWPSVAILVADNPSSCLYLESIFLDGDNYILVDSRSNTGRVKFISAKGNVTKAEVAAVPLPGASSLEGDSAISPFGLDRIAPSGDRIYAVPAKWAGALVETFKTDSGAFLDRLPEIGGTVKGLTVGPGGKVWMVTDRRLIEASAEPSTIDLGGAVPRIDSVAGHPMGFVVYSAPDLLLVDSESIVRWRIGMDSVVNGFFSPIDLAAGDDGTIAVAGAVCEFPDSTVINDYMSIRNEAIKQSNDDSIFTLEDSLRSNFASRYALLLIKSDGTITDAIDLASPPVSVAVDPSGRVHLLTQEQDVWAVSIIDPRMNKGFPVCTIPFGSPSMVSPHRLAPGPAISLYWDDIFVNVNTTQWGIAKFQLPSSGIFQLGSQSQPKWVYTEDLTSALSMATSLAIGTKGDLWIGEQQFQLNPDSSKPDEQPDTAHQAFMLHIGSDSNVLTRESPPTGLGDWSTALEIVLLPDSVMSVWATNAPGQAPMYLTSGGATTPISGIPDIGKLSGARVEKTSDGYIGWFAASNEESTEARWLEFAADFAKPQSLPRLEILGCRLLGSDLDRNELYVTIDDGEIFRLDASSYIVKGIWNNRFKTGAPEHPLDDGVFTPESLAILDREHRAVLSIGPGAFLDAPVVNQEDVDAAVSLIQAAMVTWKSSSGAYPESSPDMLDRIMQVSDRAKVSRAFLAGRIYDYRPTPTGYRFVAWSATADQPALIVDSSGAQSIR